MVDTTSRSRTDSGDNHRLLRWELVDVLFGDIQRVLDDLVRRQREPLAQADVLVHVLGKSFRQLMA